MAPSARPRTRAPTTGRQVFRVSIAVRKPVPSSPRRLPGETRQAWGRVLAGGEEGRGGVKGEHRGAEAGAFFAEAVAGGDAAVLEKDIGSGHAEHAHLAIAAGDREAGRVGGDDEGGDRPGTPRFGGQAVIAGLGEIADEVGDGAAGDVH